MELLEQLEHYVYHSVIRRTFFRLFLHCAYLQVSLRPVRNECFQAATNLSKPLLGIGSFNLMAHDFLKNAPLHFPCTIPVSTAQPASQFAHIRICQEFFLVFYLFITNRNRSK